MEAVLEELSALKAESKERIDHFLGNLPEDIGRLAYLRAKH